jgi:hypothetical protein
MKASPIYTSFSKGEISPYLYGRLDTEQYFSSLKKVRNGWIRPYGNYSRRTGSEYIGSTKNNGIARLLRFVFSNNDAFLIEVGAGYFRFFYDGAPVLSGASVYELPNTYTANDLWNIQYSQVNDVVYMTCTGFIPKKLTRLSASSWTFNDLDFKGGPFLDDNLTATTLTPSGTTGSITVTASANTFQSGHVGSFWKIGSTTGTPAVQGYVKITAYSSATSVTATVMETLSGTGATTNWAEGAWSTVRGYPSKISFYQGRLCLANSTYQPQTRWLSRSLAYEDFTAGADADNAIVSELSSDEGNAIQWLAGSTSLVSGTTGGEFVLWAGSNSEALTPSNAFSSRQSGWGSEPIQPKKIGNNLYYVQRGSRKIREQYYSWDIDSYKSVDMTILSEHITNSGIKSIAYQQNPDNLLWCLLNDGTISLFTRELDQQVIAWGLLDTKGTYESVEAIPSLGNEYDEVYVIVNRTIDGSTKRYIERFKDMVTPEKQEDCFYLDCGLCYNAYDETDTIDLTLSDDTGDITLTADSAYFNSGMVGRKIRAINEDGDIVGQCTITAFTSDTVVSATVDTNYDFDATSYTGGYWGASVLTISGLDYLEGEELDILADGAVLTPVTVDGGEVTIETPSWKVCLGLKFTSYLETLPLEAGSANGTSQGKKKRIYQMTFRVYRTLGMRYGSSLDSLVEISYRNPLTLMGSPEELIDGLISNLKFNGGWQDETTIVVEQSRPLPMNILAIMPMVMEVDR